MTRTVVPDASVVEVSIMVIVRRRMVVSMLISIRRIAPDPVVGAAFVVKVLDPGKVFSRGAVVVLKAIEPKGSRSRD